MATHGKRRALGQHFLRDQNTAKLIAETALGEAKKSECQSLLEIGPGQGALTLPLLELLRASPGGIRHFTICEKDRALAAKWRSELSSASYASVEESDFLDLAEEHWLKELPLAVVSNLPYSSGTAILTRLARHPSRIPVMVLMFQAEVAQRLRAVSGTKEWGSLSVWIQNRWDVTKLKTVPPGAFSPPPEVYSEVVVLQARSLPRFPVSPGNIGETQWESLIKACFAHRRKMLRSGLSGTPWKAALEKSGVDGTKRAENLSWEEWRSLLEAAGH